MRHFLMVFAAACATCSIALAPTARSQASDGRNIEKLILQLEQDGREATLKNDITATDRLLAENWVNVNPDGSITSRAQLMELLRGNSFKIMSIENGEVVVRVFGETAVVTGRSTTKREGQGGEVLTRQVRFTRVYAKPTGRWQVVSAHNTLIQ